MLLQTRRAGFIEPCLPSPADHPPSGSSWIHEIKHDGYRLMARRDPAGIRLITRGGHDWSARYPLIFEAVNCFKVRSCLIDGEVVCCDEKGVAAFQLLRHRRNEPRAFLYAFDLLEVNGADLRREAIEVRKATLASILRKARHGVRLNEHLEHSEGAVVFQHACKMGLEWIVSKRLGWRPTGRGDRWTGWVQESGRSGGEALLRPEPTDLYSGRLAAEVPESRRWHSRSDRSCAGAGFSTRTACWAGVGVHSER